MMVYLHVHVYTYVLLAHMTCHMMCHMTGGPLAGVQFGAAVSAECVPRDPSPPGCCTGVSCLPRWLPLLSGRHCCLQQLARWETTTTAVGAMNIISDVITLPPHTCSVAAPPSPDPIPQPHSLVRLLWHLAGRKDNLTQDACG